MALSAMPAPALTLVDGGAAKATIVYAEDAAPCVPYAAQELALHIEKMSGATLPVRTLGPDGDLGGSTEAPLIVLGDCPLARKLGDVPDDLPPDGFIIRTVENCLVIAGDDAPVFNVNYDWAPGSAGTLYGVYHLLMELGVRWFYPCDEGTVVPSLPTITLAELDLTDALNWISPMPLDSPTVSLATARRWLSGGDGLAAGETGTRGRLAIPSIRRSISGASTGRSTRSTSRSEPAASRVAALPALGHPETIPVIIEEAKAYFRGGRPPGKHYFLVIPADGLGYCACDRCRPKLNLAGDVKGQMSNIVAEAAVQVAEGVADEFPDARIVYCAYSNYYLPPTTVERFPPNVALLIAQPRRGFHDPEAEARAESVLRDWLKLRPEAVYFCRYYGGLQTMAPSLMPGIIERDIKRMASISEAGPVPIGGEMNFTGLSADDPHSWWHHLNQYLNARLLWDPDLSVDELMDDYCARFYGPAAEPMARFWDRCAELYLDDAQRAIYTVATIDELEAYILQARPLVKGTPCEARLAFIDKGFDALRMMRDKLRSAENAPEADPDADLAMHYTFDAPLDPANPTVSDETGAAEGQAFGAKTVAGVRGSALEFTGEESGLKITPLPLADTDYTLEAWVKPSIPLFEGKRFVIGPQMFDRHGLWLWHRTKSGSWDGRRLSCAGPLMGFIPGRWYHVAGTFSKTSGMTLYIDGELSAFDTTKTEPSVHVIANIGAGGTEKLTDCFPGAIDEVKVYRRELSAAEIKRSAQALRPVEEP